MEANEILKLFHKLADQLAEPKSDWREVWYREARGRMMDDTPVRLYMVARWSPSEQVGHVVARIYPDVSYVYHGFFNTREDWCLVDEAFPADTYPEVIEFAQELWNDDAYPDFVYRTSAGSPENASESHEKADSRRLQS